MRVNTTKFTGYVLIMLAFVLVGTVAYRNSTRKYVPIVFAPKSMLSSTWNRYKGEYLEEGTLRAVDRQRGNITTSEGQSYTMLRAVWQGDHGTFDTSWKWTQDNLQIKGKHLFSWLFGERSDGTFGVLTGENGQNSASDADTDIALALLFAYARWKDPAYLTAARDIISEIWTEEVIVIRGRPYLAASNAEKNYSDEIVVNPSYLAPYAYRIFAEIDRGHDWEGLIDTSYEVLEKSMAATLDTGVSAGLPPNWIGIHRSDGSITALRNPSLNTNYSYDALRVPWRIALDWQWYEEPRAQKMLSMMDFLDKEWQANLKLATEYAHDGKVLVGTETPAMYGGSLGALMAINAPRAEEAYKIKLQSLYNPDSESWKMPLGYYDENWAWFGVALYHRELPNLWKNATSTPS